MITDILGSGKPGGADAASSAKNSVAGRKGADERNGFSAALSGFDREKSTQETDDVLEGQPEGQEEPATDERQPSTNAKAAKPSPIIDIRPESLRRQQSAAETLVPKDVIKSDEAIVPKRTALQPEERKLTLAEKKLQEALTVAKEIARKSDALQNKRADEGEKSAKSVELDGEISDLDKSILGADDAKIADMLTLLNSSEAKAENVPPLPVQKNPAQGTTKRSKDADQRVTETSVAGGADPKRLSTAAGTQTAGAATMPTEPAAEVSGARQFRFTSARDSNQSMEMTVGGGRERDPVEFKQSASAATENVTVLDSRRFLGLAPSSNASNLTALMAGDSEWAAAMRPGSELSNVATQSSTGQVVNTLKLQMNPFNLGAVTATLRLHGDQLSVHLTVENRAAYKQLTDDSTGIVEALRSQGFSVDQVTINIAPTADTDSTGNQQQGQQQAGQAGQQAEGGKQGQAAGRGQEQAAGGRAGTTDEAASENTQAPASDNARPDQLYL